MTYTPTTKIDDLARFAVKPENKAFRAEALKPGNFQEALKAYAGQALDDQEVQFCEGWLYLALQQFSADPTMLDHNVVAAANAHLQAGVTTRSG